MRLYEKIDRANTRCGNCARTSASRGCAPGRADCASSEGRRGEARAPHGLRPVITSASESCDDRRPPVVWRVPLAWFTGQTAAPTLRRRRAELASRDTCARLRHRRRRARGGPGCGELDASPSRGPGLGVSLLVVVSSPGARLPLVFRWSACTPRRSPGLGRSRPSALVHRRTRSRGRGRHTASTSSADRSVTRSATRYDAARSFDKSPSCSVSSIPAARVAARRRTGTRGVRLSGPLALSPCPISRRGLIPPSRSRGAARAPGPGGAAADSTPPSRPRRSPRARTGRAHRRSGSAAVSRVGGRRRDRRLPRASAAAADGFGVTFRRALCTETGDDRRGGPSCGPRERHAPSLDPSRVSLAAPLAPAVDAAASVPCYRGTGLPRPRSVQLPRRWQAEPGESPVSVRETVIDIGSGARHAHTALAARAQRVSRSMRRRLVRALAMKSAPRHRLLCTPTPRADSRSRAGPTLSWQSAVFGSLTLLRRLLDLRGGSGLSVICSAMWRARGRRAGARSYGLARRPARPCGHSCIQDLACLFYPAHACARIPRMTPLRAPLLGAGDLARVAPSCAGAFGSGANSRDALRGAGSSAPGRAHSPQEPRRSR